MTTWTVLAPGPSLRLVRPEDLYADGPIVAINLAVLSPIRSDFWCCLDNAKKFEQVWGPLTLAQRKQLPVVWCRGQHAIHWREFGVRCWTFAERAEDFVAENLRGIGKPRFSPFHITILATISRCIGLGASHVDVFGCDMVGREHAFGADPDNRAVVHWDHRWRTEQDVLKVAIEDWARCGTTIALRRPPD